MKKNGLVPGNSVFRGKLFLGAFCHNNAMPIFLKTKKTDIFEIRREKKIYPYYVKSKVTRLIQSIACA
jgi:hypothetical protein